MSMMQLSTLIGLSGNRSADWIPTFNHQRHHPHRKQPSSAPWNQETLESRNRRRTELSRLMNGVTINPSGCFHKRHLFGRVVRDYRQYKQYITEDIRSIFSLASQYLLG
jgi:hypothetical protein